MKVRISSLLSGGLDMLEVFLKMDSMDLKAAEYVHCAALSSSTGISFFVFF